MEEALKVPGFILLLLLLPGGLLLGLGLVEQVVKIKLGFRRLRLRGRLRRFLLQQGSEVRPACFLRRRRLVRLRRTGAGRLRVPRGGRFSPLRLPGQLTGLLVGGVQLLKSLWVLLGMYVFQPLGVGPAYSLREEGPSRPRSSQGQLMCVPPDPQINSQDCHIRFPPDKLPSDIMDWLIVP